MTALCRSSLVDCMVRALCWPWTYRLYVYISACVLECEVLIGYWCLMKYEVVNLRSCVILVSECTTIAVCVCLNLEVLINYRCLMKYEVVNSFTLMRHFGVHKYTSMVMTTLGFVCVEYIMERVSRWPWTNRKYVYIIACVCAWATSIMVLVFDASQHEVARILTFMHCPNNYNGDDGSARLLNLRWLNVWNGCRVGPWRTARTFVFIAAWLLEVEDDTILINIGVPCSMRSYVISPSCAILLFK